MNRFGLGHRRDPWVFAVEDTTVQLTWASLDARVVRARVGPATVAIDHDGGPGSVIVDGLPAGSLLEVALERADDTVAWRRPAHMLAPPPGPELFRFATLSDMHLGERHFGYRGTIVEKPRAIEPYSVRATRTAIAELSAWGAQLLVIKGDVTLSGQAEQWHQFGELIASFDGPVLATPGNHDGIEDVEPTGWHKAIESARVFPEPSTALTPSEGLRRLGLGSTDRVQVRDEPGIRIVLVDTTVPHRREGQLDVAADELLAPIADAEGAVWVGLHHQLMTTRVPTYLPVGISRDESRRFLDRAVAANPDLFVTSGHTHRNRRRAHGPVPITEVGSPKDYPGVWAGYVVHEGGIRQVVRRVAAPDVLAWTDRSADAAHGVWGVWSPGQLDERCFTHTWPSYRRGIHYGGPRIAPGIPDP